MSLLDRILGRTPAGGPQIAVAPKLPPVTELPATAVSANAGTPSAAGADERLTRVYDQFGRALSIGRESWRRDVLLPGLEANRGKPDALYNLIAGALDDGFAADVLDAARLLAESDPQPQRGAMLLGATLLQLKDFVRAREVLERAIAKHGENAYLLAHLARAFDAAGDHEQALALIWRALQMDPNAETTLNWSAGFANEKGGPAAMLAAYARAAALPGSWRAQLWLARHALEVGDLAEATRLYEEALSHAKPVPGDLLMQMSGDLGNGGHNELLVRLTQPRFDALTHGLLVGNNLLRAYIDLGMFAEARKLLEQLYSQQRPDWHEHLVPWEQKLDDAQRQYAEAPTPVSVTVMRLEQPVWARGVLGFEQLLPAKAPSAPEVQFMCASGQSAASDIGGNVMSQPATQLGRITRALPMFLAEEVYLRTNARSVFLFPWAKPGHFMVAGQPWTREFLQLEHAPPDVLVFMHVDATGTPWQLRVSIEQPRRAGEAVLTFERAFDPESCAHDTLTLLHDVIARVTSLLALRREETAAALATPLADTLPAYLAASDTALALGLAAQQRVADVYEDRASIDQLFDVAIQGSELWRPRMLLVNALENETRRRPDIVREYLDKLAALELRHPLPHGAGQELVAKAVATVAGKAQSTT